ncbi:hypothetical protein BT96DRAFT_968994 [Gymnopus androsaceus JB14]|uniref:Uncharacterized protein n=1 Tax=Gymnopus androsaceus JB14 TaxID=1447944 RepID=A0A6A4IUU9_9AGAR|nr:hypothetical protein BT96DRAFT_968994 [Gymnopus androsaceus JB14]
MGFGTGNWGAGIRWWDAVFSSAREAESLFVARLDSGQLRKEKDWRKESHWQQAGKLYERVACTLVFDKRRNKRALELTPVGDSGAHAQTITQTNTRGRSGSSMEKEGKEKAKEGRRWPSYSSKKRSRTDSDDDEFIGPMPGPSNYKPDYEAIRAELEEQRFREKMAMAFEDDERLDSVEASFNSFAHVPMHWGGASQKKARIDYDHDEFLNLDPKTMDDEEYAEWIRMGMYRKTHAQEIAEKEQKKAERAAKRAQEKSIRAETERLEELAASERRFRKRTKENHKLEQLRSEYHHRWKLLLSTTPGQESEVDLGFNDIPWPILFVHRQKNSDCDVLSLDDFTRDAISTFLFTSLTPAEPLTDSGDGQSLSAQRLAERAGRKDKLRETLLRFHPDKFEGRLMSRVRPNEKDKVREALGVVVRVLNDLMGEG